MKVFIFYSAHLEIEKDIQEREKLIEQIQAVDKRLNVRNGLLIGMLKGIIENQQSQNTSVQRNLLLSGGTEVKYQGITIHKHTSCNTWYARYRFGGKQHYVSARTQQLCYDKLKHALSKSNLKQLQKTITNNQEPSITFIEWFKKWKSLYKQNIKQTTSRVYDTAMVHLQAIHHLPIAQITSIVIQEQLNKISGERAKQKVYEIANAIFQKAVDNDFIIKNPMTVIEKPKHHKTNGNALSNEDEKRLEIIFKQNGYDIFLICLYQGLRRGEALALTRDDIDFENKTLRINKSFNYFNELDTTKNRHSVRTMPLFEKTAAILESYRNTQGRLFNISQQVIEKRFNKCIVDFKTKYTIHSLRHTFITRCQEAQIPLHIIQKWVGHVAGSSVTNSVYTHARNDAEVENINILNQKLNSN